ncbi:MAG: hypothetical protein ABF289_16775 [Clostridiales bacterium]
MELDHIEILKYPIYMLIYADVKNEKLYDPETNRLLNEIKYKKISDDKINKLIVSIKWALENKHIQYNKIFPMKKKNSEILYYFDRVYKIIVRISNTSISD